jgi:hypothetical protein
MPFIIDPPNTRLPSADRCGLIVFDIGMMAMFEFRMQRRSSVLHFKRCSAGQPTWQG